MDLLKDMLFKTTCSILFNEAQYILSIEDFRFLPDELGYCNICFQINKLRIIYYSSYMLCLNG